ncbi:MAG: hypothetical protein IJK26_09420 [Clostridia bacterium]|nr:hypothetical protein [Clostridia bacterium]
MNNGFIRRQERRAGVTRADKLVMKTAATAFVLFGLEAIGFTIALIIRSEI